MVLIMKEKMVNSIIHRLFLLGIKDPEDISCNHMIKTRKINTVLEIHV